MKVSVLTLVRGRATHLANLIAGLNCQTLQPDELVIAYMQPAVHPRLPRTAFPVRTIMVPGDPMPLAAARNRAANAAIGDEFIFLDVDCIPAPGLVARYARTSGGIRLGEVLYLPADAVGAGLDFDALDALGQLHPAKLALAEDEVRRTPDHGELWGLSFAISADDWVKAGGMDERYTGYGAEETDFAARLAAAGVPMYCVGGARAYHQHHAIHIPPYQHFDHIVRNAGLFRATWGRWCMDYWLEQFARCGLIARRDDDIIVLRRPAPEEIEAARAPTSALFS